MRAVLIIDDQQIVLDALSLLLSLNEIRVLTALTPDDGLALLARHQVDLVIADMNFGADTTSGEEGVALFHAIRNQQPDLPVILITAWSHVETAVQLIKAGAADYVSKPWDNAKLLATVENLLELSENARKVETTRRSQRRRREALDSSYDLRGTVFVSDEMLSAVELACRVARTSAPVLITGPNGTGKQHIAEIVHANSAVGDKPLTTVNCGALPSELIEAELFGSEPGAYTGATRTREGRFEAADGGTLFLDEVGNLPSAGQMKLLRVLESGEFERLGSAKTRKVTVRVISATNADLMSMIRKGKFREDLYHRLNTIKIDLPSLAERTDDILPLAEHFLGSDASLSDAAREALMAYPWPGNVRELKNTLQRAKVLCDKGKIEASGLGLPDPASSAAPLIPRDLDSPSREVVEQALQDAGGVITDAAHRLGLSRQALYRRMQRYGISEASHNTRTQ